MMRLDEHCRSTQIALTNDMVAIKDGPSLVAANLHCNALRHGALETALIVEDVARATLFYRKIFGFDVLAQTVRLSSLNVKPAQVLLLFQRGGSLDDIPLPGGILPGDMDAEGRSHMAFAIEAEHLESWQHWLKQNGVVIESTVHWDSGAPSFVLAFEQFIVGL